jgi:hypothetical protein
LNGSIEESGGNGKVNGARETVAQSRSVSNPEANAKICAVRGWKFEQ